MFFSQVTQILLIEMIDYTLKDGAQEYKPTFTVHGFQYVKLENWPEEIKTENFTSVAVYSDLKRAGWTGDIRTITMCPGIQ